MSRRRPHARVPRGVPLQLVWDATGDAQGRNDTTNCEIPPMPIEQARDTVMLLQELLAAARSGQLVGLSLVALYSSRACRVEVTDGLHESPTFALGAVDLLAAKVRRLAEATGAP